MKNTYVKQFLHRGLLFGGFGPIVTGVVFLVLSATVDGFILTGEQVFLAILSTYLLAFVHAGASVFNQIESWPVGKSLLCHLVVLYLAYVTCYLVNAWIPFEWLVVGIFTAIFVVGYFIIWISVYLSLKAISRKCNASLR